MDWGKLSIASVVGGIVNFFAGWVIWGMMLKDTLSLPDGTKIADAEMNLGLMFLSCLVWAALLAFLIKKNGISTWKSGAILAAIMGVLISLSMGFGNASFSSDANFGHMLIDTIANGVASAITGAAIGWYYGRE